MGQGLVQSFVGDVRLVVRIVGPVPSDEFDAHIVEAVERKASVRVSLVVVVGAGTLHADARHRAKLLQAGLLEMPFALLADLPARHHETALRWLGARMRLFARNEFDKACDFLAIDAVLRPPIARAVETLSGQLKGPEPTSEARIARAAMRDALDTATAFDVSVPRLKTRSAPPRS